MYMIHACEKREWYVEKFLIPSLVSQGVPKEEIKIFVDREHLGNLRACMKCFAECGKHKGVTWHLQDDVIICRDFYNRTKDIYDADIVCGFCGKGVGPNVELTGEVKPFQMWMSFQCICISNELAGYCAEWFEEDASKRTEGYIADRVAGGKSDDWMFRRFLTECHPDAKVINLSPNLVDHIDHLLGGSIINKQRKRDNTAAYFRDGDLVQEICHLLRSEEDRSHE